MISLFHILIVFVLLVCLGITRVTPCKSLFLADERTSHSRLRESLLSSPAYDKLVNPEKSVKAHVIIEVMNIGLDPVKQVKCRSPSR